MPASGEGEPVPALSQAAGAPAPVEAAAPPAAATEAPQSAAHHILLVEDDFLIRMNTVDMLMELGHTAIEAGSAEEALDLVGSGGFDILLTDMGLPNMSGSDLAVAVRMSHPDVGVIFATGHSHLPDVPGARRPVLLQKPFGLAELQDALRAAGQA